MKIATLESFCHIRTLDWLADLTLIITYTNNFHVSQKHTFQYPLLKTDNLNSLCVCEWRVREVTLRLYAPLNETSVTAKQAKAIIYQRPKLVFIRAFPSGLTYDTFFWGRGNYNALRSVTLSQLSMNAKKITEPTRNTHL